MSDGGKGDKQRPTNHAAFSSNWDKIFGAKPEKRLIDMTEEDFNEALGITTVTEHERSGTMEDQKPSGEPNGTAPNLPSDSPQRRDASR